MTIQEILKSQGLSDEQVENVLGEMKQNKIFTSSEENIDIRFNKLKTDAEGKAAELEKANGLIAELQKSAKGNEEMQGKITAYQTEVDQLRSELEKTKIDAAIKVGLLSEKALDVDYLTFKLREQDGDGLKLDEHGNIKGWADKVAGLKTQFPTQFESAKAKQVEPNRLPEPEEKDKGLTRSEVLKKPYAERMKLFSEDPEGYREIMHDTKG